MGVNRKVGGLAAYVNAVVSLATLLVALVWIGVDVLTDSQRLIDLAVNNPAPLLTQDALKLASVVVSGVLVLTMYKLLNAGRVKLVIAATLFGSLAILCLLLNTCLSLFSVLNANNTEVMSSAMGDQAKMATGLLGLLVVFFNGLWYLLISLSARKDNRFPKWLIYIGLVMGSLSLFPPLGILVLLLSIFWSIGLGRVLTERVSAFAA